MSVVNAPVAYESKVATVNSSAATIGAFVFTPTKLATADFIVLTARGCDVAFYFDSTVPNASEPHVLATNASITLAGQPNIQNFRFIAVSGSGTLAGTICGYSREPS